MVGEGHMALCNDYDLTRTTLGAKAIVCTSTVGKGDKHSGNTGGERSPITVHLSRHTDAVVVAGAWGWPTEALQQRVEGR